MKSKLAAALAKLKEKYADIDLSVLKQYLPTSVPPDRHLDWLDVSPSEISVHPYVDSDLFGNTEEGWHLRTRALYVEEKENPDDALLGFDGPDHRRHDVSAARRKHEKKSTAGSDAESGSGRCACG